jgi:enoyl-CoA hydratase
MRAVRDRNRERERLSWPIGFRGIQKVKVSFEQFREVGMDESETAARRWIGDMNMQTWVATELQEGVLWVRLQRTQKRNALSRQLLACLKAAFIEWRNHDNVRLAVLIGDGDRAFASGGDLKELANMRDRDAAPKFADETRAVLDCIRQFPVPVIAALNGDALGGGAELALACDMRFAAAHARIGFLQGGLGISTAWGGGTDLIRAVGTVQALALLCGAEVVSAEQALAMKLISSIAVTGESFAAQVGNYATRLARRPQHVMRAFKALTTAFREGASSEDLAVIEGSHFARTWIHEDHWTAVANAFPPR